MRSLAARVVPLCALLTLVAVDSLAKTQPPQELAQTAERGVRAYLRGQFAEAMADLEKVRQGGQATGPVLYMLGYCYQTVRRDAEASAEAYAASEAKLREEIAQDNPPLESYFYLANHHQNLQDVDTARRLSEAAAAAIEQKKIRVGDDGTSQFRAGKIHADAGRSEAALAFYQRALTAFAKEDNPPPEYLRRALGAFPTAGPQRLDPALALSSWEKLLKIHPSVPDGDWNLARTALQAGRYSMARDAFSKVRGESGDRAQDAFYASKVAEAALALTEGGVKIASNDSQGRSIATLAPADLDEQMADCSRRAGERIAREVGQDEYILAPGKRGGMVVRPGAAIEKELSAIQSEFVALSIQLVSWGASLQAKAFEGGYAPLVIQDWHKLWRLAHRERLGEIQSPQEPEGE